MRQEGHPTLEVMGQRELGFWPGTARGAAIAGFQYQSELGAVAASLRFVNSYSHHSDAAGEAQGQGGAAAAAGAPQPSCSGQEESMSPGGVASTARRRPGSHAARGLQPWHLRPRPAHAAEQPPSPSSQQQPYGPHIRWSKTLDYMNGGPVFVLDEPDSPRAQDEDLAREQDQPHYWRSRRRAPAGAPAPPTAELMRKRGATEGEIDARRLRLGGRFAAPRRMPAGTTALATYESVGPGALAAVRCAV